MRQPRGAVLAAAIATRVHQQVRFQAQLEQLSQVGDAAGVGGLEFGPAALLGPKPRRGVIRQHVERESGVHQLRLPLANVLELLLQEVAEQQALAA